MASLTIDNARKSYGPVEVLKGIDIEVEDGGFLVLLGPSGCGKSTLLNMIAGLETITDGEIRIGEDRMNDLHPKDRDIAMVFQSYALYPNMTVEQNIAFGMEMRGVPKPEREKTIGEVAKLLQIEPLLKRKPSQLSGGQRQRVAIGRALTRHPKVFLFDEPLSNLDAKLRVEMRTEIKKLHHRLGVTIVYVTHDQIEAMTMGTHIAIMHGGEVQQFGPPQEVYDRPANTFVATFIGSPSMNLIPAHISDDGLSVIVDRVDGSRTVLPLFEPNEAHKAAAGKAVKLGLRPEHISDPRSQEAHSEHHHEISALVEVTEPTGPDTLAVIMLGGIECTARMRADTDAKDEEWANFMVDMSKASLFDPDSGLRIG